MKLIFISIACLVMYQARSQNFSYEDSIPKMQLLWKFKTDGKVFTTPCRNGDLLYFGSEDKKIYALDIHSGKLKWSFTTGGSINSSPAFDKGKIYALSIDGYLYALNADNGEPMWKFKTNGESKHDLWDYYLSDPCVDKGTVYFGSGDSNVYAVNAQTGNLVWKFKTEGTVHAGAAIHNDTVYIGSFDGYMYSLKANNGELIWKFKSVGDLYFPRGDFQKAALYYNNRIWVGSRDYNIYALNHKTGRGLWNMKETDSWVTATPFGYKNFIYFGTSDSHKFYCIDINTGYVKWKLGLNMRVYASAIEDYGMIWFGCYNGKFYGVDAMTGQMKKIFQTEGNKKNYFSVYDSAGNFRKDFEQNPSSMEEAISGDKKLLSIGGIPNTALLIDHVVYFGSTDGYLYAVKTGN